MTTGDVPSISALGSTTDKTSHNHGRIKSGQSISKNRPLGIKFFGLFYTFDTSNGKRTYYRALVLLLTFITYAVFHMGRRPLSIVMNVLNRNCSALYLSEANKFNPGISRTINLNSTLVDNSCNWAPFTDQATANRLLAILDASFQITYALVMFVSGIIAERMNLRHLVTLGSLISGFGLIAFGLSYPLDIHSMAYYTTIQIVMGAAQSVGWPVVVTCVSNWFVTGRSGLIYGLWNSHLSLGNILGATIAGFFVEKNWGLSFMVPGCILILAGILQFLFLVPTPQEVGLTSVKKAQSETNSRRENSNDASLDPFVENKKDSKRINNFSVANDQDSKPVSFWTALMIPGVIEYSLCLLFAKLVSYAFLYYLPRYIASSTTNNSEHSAYLSTPFDVGGVLGSVVAGYLSDRLGTNGIICNVMLAMAIPGVFVYQKYGSYSNTYNIVLQFFIGILINGPYCLITTVVSADLGTRVKSGRAMATVVAIIDGMGSIGSVLGSLSPGFISSSFGWQAVFIMLMISDVLASLCLVRVTFAEIKKKYFK